MAVASASAWLASWSGAPSAKETEWANELAEAQHLLRDVAVDLSDREAKFRRGADAARLTAGIRRRVAARGAFRPGWPLGCRGSQRRACAPALPAMHAARVVRCRAAPHARRRRHRGAGRRLPARLLTSPPRPGRRAGRWARCWAG
jgi:hypothetical protein